MIDNPYAPRNYGDFYVVLLLNHLDRYDDEGDPVFPPTWGPGYGRQKAQRRSSGLSSALSRPLSRRNRGGQHATSGLIRVPGET